VSSETGIVGSAGADVMSHRIVVVDPNEYPFGAIDDEF
jgi:hypothetical protein